MEKFRIKISSVNLHPISYSEYLGKHEFNLSFEIDRTEAELLEKYIAIVGNEVGIELNIIPKKISST